MRKIVSFAFSFILILGFITFSQVTVNANEEDNKEVFSFDSVNYEFYSNDNDYGKLYAKNILNNETYKLFNKYTYDIEVGDEFILFNTVEAGKEDWCYKMDMQGRLTKLRLQNYYSYIILNNRIFLSHIYYSSKTFELYSCDLNLENKVKILDNAMLIGKDKQKIVLKDVQKSGVYYFVYMENNQVEIEQLELDNIDDSRYQYYFNGYIYTKNKDTKKINRYDIESKKSELVFNFENLNYDSIRIESIDEFGIYGRINNFGVDSIKRLFDDKKLEFAFDDKKYLKWHKSENQWSGSNGQWVEFIGTSRGGLGNRDAYRMSLPIVIKHKDKKILVLNMLNYINPRLKRFKKVNIETGEIKKLYTPNKSELSLSDGFFVFENKLYISNSNKPKIFDLDTGKHLSNINLSGFQNRFRVSNDKIYFTKYNGDKKGIAYIKDGKEKLIYGDGKVYSNVKGYGKYVFFQSYVGEGKDSLFRVDIDGTNHMKIAENIFDYEVGGDWIYYFNNNPNNREFSSSRNVGYLYKMRMDGSNKKKLSDTLFCGGLRFDNGQIYTCLLPDKKDTGWMFSEMPGGDIAVCDLNGNIIRHIPSFYRQFTQISNGEKGMEVINGKVITIDSLYDGAIWRINNDGKVELIDIEDEQYGNFVAKDGDWVYYYEYTKEKQMYFDKKSEKWVEITDNETPSENLYYATILNDLGLLKGSKQGYRLNKKPTKLEGLVMFIRLLGKEQEALELSDDICQFDDVPKWAIGYVNYAYNNGLTQGVSGKEFGVNNHLSAGEYISLLLKALNYSDKEGDFNASNAISKAYDMNMFYNNVFKRLSKEEFLRSDMVFLTYQALQQNYKGTREKLLNKLDADGIIDKNKLPEEDLLMLKFVNND